MKFFPGKRIYLVLILIAAAIGSGAWWYFGVKKKQVRRTYKEFSVTQGNLEVSVQATGQVQPENRLVVKPAIAGRIETVLADEGRAVKAGQVLAWMSSSDRAALLDMAKAQGEKEVSHWEEIYKPSPIIAPLSGFVIAKNIERGQVVATSDTAFVISDRLVVNAQVDETDLARVHMNQSVVITLDAYNDQPIDGKVVRIAYEARTANNVTIYDIRVLPDKVPAFMRSGMTASVRFIETTKEGVLMAPSELFKKVKTTRELRRPGSEVKVLIKTGEEHGSPTFTEQSITLGTTDGQMVEITKGLKGSETLLLDTTPEIKGAANPFSPFGSSKSGGNGGKGGGKGSR